MGNLITIAEVEGPKADFIKSVLETHGITVFVENPHTSSILGRQMAITARIQVPEDQIDKAQEILQTIEESQVKDDIDSYDDFEYDRTGRLTKLTRIVNIVSLIGLLFFLVGTSLFFTNLPKNVRMTEGSVEAYRQQQEINKSRISIAMAGAYLSGLGTVMITLRIIIYLWTPHGTRMFLC